MARKSAAGSGTIRKKTVTRKGKSYTYWEARYTEGYDPGTGKQIQRSITGKTQKEVAQKLKAATAAIDAGTYTAPNKMTFGEWLDIWTAEYLGGVKPGTAATYKSAIETRRKPGLGATRLEALSAHMIQSFYNSLQDPEKTERVLSSKMVKNIHGIIHKALHQAVLNGIIRFNPSTACVLPRVEKRKSSHWTSCRLRTSCRPSAGVGMRICLPCRCLQVCARVRFSGCSGSALTSDRGRSRSTSSCGRW